MAGNDGVPPRVVVGVDGSPSSRAALRWAVGHARLLGGVVEVVGVVELPVNFGWSAPVVDTTFDEDVTRRRFTEELDAVLGAGERPVAVRELLVRGDPVEALLEAGRGAEVLVVGSRGHGSVARALLGSVSTEVARQAPCPVVIVRPEER
ncbi:universal stress protein [Kitasatospora sp. NBC_01287]|uniref:universal stress protein n=1 Tax=Kitasatospora sp. NBC_01287 TaxID=2903573 RepID=UPI00225C327B|nr:universal stress protein [Kitasatospora sp. NBC_01287]MCX4744144.1 universal stress protein [Kitasatospora sp. NBC_01287]